MRASSTLGVLGATGLIGRHVVEALVGADMGPIVATHRIRTPYAAPGVEWVRCDLHDRDSILRALRGVDTAVICAGQVSTSAVLRDDPIASVLETLRVVTNALEAAAMLRIRKVILISSCTGYPVQSNPLVEADMETGDPPAQWFGVGWMHRYLEKQLRWYGEVAGRVDSAGVLRPALVYGPYDSFASESAHFVPTLVRKVVERERPIVIWGDGEQTRNLLHAADLARAVLDAMRRHTRQFEAFNIVSSDEVSVNSVLRGLVEIDGFIDAEVVHDPARSGGSSGFKVSGAEFTRATGWKPQIGLREGLANVLLWYRKTRR